MHIMTDSENACISASPNKFVGGGLVGGETGLNSVAGYVAVFGDKSLRISLRGSDLTKKS